MTKMQFKNALDDVGLKVGEFAKMTGLTTTTIYSYNDETRPFPAWVEPFLANYKKAKMLDDILKMAKAVQE